MPRVDYSVGIAERKEREFLRREGEILDAALALFNAENWLGITIDQIARRAEIGKGTIYRHFASKDEIYARLVLDFYRDMLARLNAVPGDSSVLEQLGAVIRAAWQCHLRGREYHRLITYCQRDDFRRSLSPQSQSAFDDLEREFFALLQRLLRQGIAEGVLPAAPLARMFNMLRAALDGAAMLVWQNGLGQEDPKAFIDAYIRFMIAGLRFHQAASASSDAGA